MSIFNKIKLNRPKRSLHNLTYPLRLSTGFGDLIPIVCEKVVPGDKFKHSHEFLMRFSPMVSQLYQAFDVKVEYFFVPSRLLWQDFERFLVEDDNTIYPHPQMNLSLMYDGVHTMENTLVDYINKVAGKPTYTGGVFSFEPYDFTSKKEAIDAMPYAALLKVYLDYYADENLTYGTTNSPGVLYTFEDLIDKFEDLTELKGATYGNFLFSLLGSVNHAGTSINPRDIFQFFKRSYPKDYFTSALPWAQRGPLVQIPLNGSGDVQVIGDMVDNRSYHGVSIKYNPVQGPGYIEDDVEVTLYPNGPSYVGSSPITLGSTSNPDAVVLSGLGYGNIIEESSQNAGVSRLISNAADKPLRFKAVNVNGTATITDLRTAMTVQAWLEKNARAGVRYKEQLASHFGVRSKDYRLDRAEMLQSSKSHISIGEVFTTAQNDDASFVPGLGVSTGTGSAAVKPFKHFFEEHGYFVGFLSVFPKAAYSQGLPRQLLELDKFDYYWPEFQHIGEQPIYNCELFLDDSAGADNMGTFGYTPRYAHYKTRSAEVHGDLLNTLNFMTLSRQFSTIPKLNQGFINIDPDKNHLYRAFNAVKPYGDALPVQVDFLHKFKSVRPMSYFGSPRII